MLRFKNDKRDITANEVKDAEQRVNDDDVSSQLVAAVLELLLEQLHARWRVSTVYRHSATIYKEFIESAVGPDWLFNNQL